MWSLPAHCSCSLFPPEKDRNLVQPTDINIGFVYNFAKKIEF